MTRAYNRKKRKKKQVTTSSLQACGITSTQLKVNGLDSNGNLELVNQPVEEKLVEVVPEAPVVEIPIAVVYPGDDPPADYKNLGHWGNVPELIVDGPDWIWECPNWKCRSNENRCSITEFVDWFHMFKKDLKSVTCQGCGRRYVFPGQILDRLLEALIEEFE